MRCWLLILLLFFSELQADLKKSETEISASLAAYIQPQPEGNRIGKIRIDDRSTGITQSTWVYVKNALDYYKQNPPLFIILELNTPGGEVFVSQKISDALKEMDIQYGVPIITVINNWAISAGAMLAYSTRYIAVVKDASMGAAEPVLQDTTSGELKAASEKVNSALRSDFANRARFFDRNPFIAEAMVDKDIILVLRDGKIVKLDTESQIRTQEPQPDLLITPKGKLLTLNSEQLLEYGVADIYLPPERLSLRTEEEKSLGKWPASKELLFESPFFNFIHDATIDEYQMDWKTLFFTFITNPYVTSLLFLGMMLGAYMEFNTPGFGLPGAVAIACLVLLTMSSFALEIANWFELILLLLGLTLILIDLFLLPTFGLLGILGMVLFFVGLLALLLPGIGSIDFEYDTNTFNAAGEAFIQRLGWLMGTIGVGFILIALLSRYITPSFKGFNRFVLQGDEQVGYISGLDPKTAPPIGTIGIVVATLRPAGKVEIQNVLYDAMSIGKFIEKGAKVAVRRIEGGNLIVEEKEI